MSVTYGTARVPCIIQYALRLYSAIFAPQHPQKTKPSFISAPHTGHFLAGFSPASFAGSGSRREPHCVQNRSLPDSGRQGGTDHHGFRGRIRFLFRFGGSSVAGIISVFLRRPGFIIIRAVSFGVIFPFYPLDLSLCLLNRLIMCGGGSAEILDFCVDGVPLLQIFYNKNLRSYSVPLQQHSFLKKFSALSFVISMASFVLSPIFFAILPILSKKSI